MQISPPASGKHAHPIVVLFYVLFVLYRSTYCLCVNVYYCHRLTTQLQLTNISYIKNNAFRGNAEVGLYVHLTDAVIILFGSEQLRH